MENILTKKDIKKLIKEKIQSGISKQQIFEELIQGNTIGKDLAKIIQSIPSETALKKYKFLHTLFLVLLIVLLVILITNLNYAGITWTAAIIYLVVTKQAKFYGWSLVAGLYGITPGFILIQNPPEDAITAAILIGSIILLIAALIIFLGFYLSYKLTPGYIENKELYTDESGNQSYRLIVKFRE
jgi:hypothetical protein